MIFRRASLTEGAAKLQQGPQGVSTERQRQRGRWWERQPAASAAACGGGAVARDELWAVLFFLRECGIGLEAAAAAGFVGAHRADNNQLLALDEALGVNGRIAAAHTDGEQLGDLLGDGEQARHRFEWAAPVV